MDAADLLAQRRHELDVLIARLDADDDALRRDRADATADDEHDPEGSTLSGEWQRVEALRRGAREELVEVDASLARLAAGTYGICERCGRGIPLARLEVRPHATRCVSCAGA